MIGVLKRQFDYLRQHWFVKNALLLQVGTFAGTLTQAVTGIILARLLQPELFGIYTLAFGIAGLTSLFLGGGAQDAVSVIVSEAYVEKNETKLREGFAYLIKVSLVASLLALVLAVWAPILTDLLYGNRLIGWYAMVIISAAATSTLFFSVVSLGLQVSGEIKKLTLLITADQVLRFGLSLLFALNGGGILGAVFGHLAGSIIVFVISIRIWARLYKQNPMFPRLRQLLREVKNIPLVKYLNFSFWITLDRNVSTLYATLPVLLTGLFLSPTHVTFFKLAFGYLNIALSLLGPISILLNVEFPKMKVADLRQLLRSFTKVSWYGLALSAALTVGAIAVSPVAFDILYGKNFRASVPYVFGLAIYGVLFGIGVGLGPMWRAINKVRASIVINLITLGVGVPLGIKLIERFGLWGSVAAVTFWYTFSHFASYFYIRFKLARLLNA
ncbi:MAG: oligosaccharide flippase family protein [Candidatus Yanofskybacteria bacterium]|nr:oligosaccharide flippase family protein [Candidatus Yanofskybacteria bacterium]